MEKLLNSPNEPFFNQFRQMSLSYFTREDSFVMIKQLLSGINIDEKEVLLIFKYTLGHPFYIAAVCERIFLETDGAPNEVLVNYAVVKETVDKNG